MGKSESARTQIEMEGSRSYLLCNETRRGEARQRRPASITELLERVESRVVGPTYMYLYLSIYLPTCMEIKGKYPTPRTKEADERDDDEQSM